MKNTFNPQDSKRIELLQQINHSGVTNEELESIAKFIQKKGKNKTLKAA